MIQLTAHPEGVVLPVRASPGARRNELGGEHDGELRVRVTAAPEKGKANQAVLKLLAKQLGLRKAQLELCGGAASPRKRVLIRGMSLEELRRRLAAAGV